MQKTNYGMDVWRDPAALQGWEDRAVAFEASQLIVDDVARKHINPAQPIVEIGSGLGALGEMMPSIEVTAYVEGSFDSAKLHQQKTEGQGTNVQGDLYRLPLRTESVGSVVGLLLIDAMMDAPAVIDEVVRVLQPEGRFVYFQDRHASSNALGTFIRAEGCTPVPLANKTLAVMDSREFNRFSRLARKAWARTNLDAKTVMRYLATDTDQLDFWNMKQPDIVRAMTDVIMNDAKLKETVAGDQTQLFAKMLRQVTERAGLSVIENSVWQAENLLERSEAKRRGYDLVDDINIIGTSAMGVVHDFSPQVPAGKVLTVAEILTFVAQKPAI